VFSSGARSATFAIFPTIALLLLAGCDTPSTPKSPLSQAVTQPDIKPSDTWRYSIGIDWRGFERTSHVREDRIARVGVSDFVLSYASDGGYSTHGAMLLQKDWSTRRQFNHIDAVFTRRFSFPLSPGKTWEVQLNFPYDQTHHVYEVMGWEKVTVPAGTFDALRVEDHGTGLWQHELLPMPALPMPPGSAGSTNGPSTAGRTDPRTNFTPGGRLYGAYWYMPAIKREVKSIEEEYDAGGELEGRITFQLISYDVH